MTTTVKVLNFFEPALMMFTALLSVGISSSLLALTSVCSHLTMLSASSVMLNLIYYQQIGIAHHSPTLVCRTDLIIDE